MPEIWKLVRPRRWLLAFGFFLMIINRVAGLVLPFSTKFLIDQVLGANGNPKLLMPLPAWCSPQPPSRPSPRFRSPSCCRKRRSA